MRDRVGYFGAALSISLLLGCGGGINGNPPMGGTGTGGTGGTGGGSSVPGNKKLMTLTEAEATQVCKDLGAYQIQNISKRGLCKLAGITSANLVATIDPTSTDTDLQTACNLGVDQCNAYPTDPTTSCPLGDPSTCTPTPTVDDLTKCNTDDVAAVNATMAALPACSQITRAWLNANASTAGMVPTPVSCTALHAECPDILAM